ncbi:hypothetical protein SDC9_208337 [bioreactor metagenome]|uniref:Uncharacterized protein n=1 Tax=bioreactor metagenome TaxID=1076179 RepID=A0A645JAC5_9ZZZZ
MLRDIDLFDQGNFVGLVPKIASDGAGEITIGCKIFLAVVCRATFQITPGDRIQPGHPHMVRTLNVVPRHDPITELAAQCQRRGIPLELKHSLGILTADVDNITAGPGAEFGHCGENGIRRAVTGESEKGIAPGAVFGYHQCPVTA